ncbi:methylamine utilization protein [Pseudomonas sp. RIT-To-2]|uniref:methylamine utilization protein n=1 Tax=Pseudomonas sp. RIT-To-2 TaxID=3462541 RepID=UPI002413A006
MARIRVQLAVLILALGASAFCAAAPLKAQVLDAQGKPLAGAVLSLSGDNTAGNAVPTASMDQVKQEFVPHVLAVHTGTRIRFPNSDNIRHQVYSFSPAKRFELRLYEGTPTDPLLFDKPGVVVLGCNIHDWMLGYIYVTDDPWFAVSGADGTLSLDVPPGRYQATLWHPQLPDQRVSPGGTIDVAASGLQRSWTLTVEPLTADTPHAPETSGFGDAFNKAVRETEK